MHRTMGYLSKRFVQVRPGEGRKTLLTFLYFFLIITAYYVIKPVSRSLILGDLGSRMVPYVDLICAIVMGPIVTLFARLVDRLKKPQLVTYAFWAVIGTLLVFWKLLALPFAWVSGAFYVWVSVFSVLVVTLFWLVANDLFRPREAKRLFGFIGSGGILGGIVGSSIAAVGARLIGTERLILLSAAILVLSWWLVKQLWKLAPQHEAPHDPGKPAAEQKDSFLSDPSGFLRLLLESRYLLLLVAVVGLAKIISTLVYYQFNPFIEQAFPDADARTAFTGMFFGAVNIIAFVIQFGLTSWVLRSLGLRTALCALPLGLLVGSVGLLLWPGLLVAAVIELYDGSMNYSLQQTTKELLYLPINRSIRYKVKPFIDMVIFRFGKGVAAIVGIICLHGMQLKPQFLGFLSLPLLGLWVLVAVWLCREYISTIRTALQARAAALRSKAQSFSSQPAGRRNGSSHDAAVTGELFGPLTEMSSAFQKLKLMDQLVSTHESPPIHVRDLLTELAAQENLLVSSADMGLDATRLKGIIGDQIVPMATRRQAVRLLTRLVNQDSIDYLFGMLLVEEDAVLRQEAVLGLIRLRLKRRSLEFPAAPIRRQVAHGVQNYQRIVSVATIYRKHHRGPLASDDPALGLLRALLEESVEHIFRLLMLLYRPEDIHLVFEQLKAPDAHLRADAVELLDNLVDSGMRSLLLPILDEDRFLSLLDQESPVVEPAAAYRILQEAIWDHNYWLSITTLCAVGRLRLSSMSQELERASRHSARLISTAAKTALYLATRP